MTDADLSTPIEDLAAPHGAARRGLRRRHRLARAARAATSRSGSPPTARSWAACSTCCVRVLAVPGLHDTQCGFKLFTAAAAERRFEPRAARRLLVRRGGALHRAPARASASPRCPVTWRNDAASRVGLAERLPRLPRPRPDPRQRLAGPVPVDGVVAHLRRRPQVLHPGLDPRVQLASTSRLEAAPLGRRPGSSLPGPASSTRTWGRNRKSTYLRIVACRRAMRRSSRGRSAPGAFAAQRRQRAPPPPRR